MLSAYSNRDIIAKAEEILWTKIPSNTQILSSLESKKLKNENSLPEMRHLLNLLGHNTDDLNDLKTIHITGSKGKGSTASFLESIFRYHGLRTALYTSPHLVHPRERLRINGYSTEIFEFSELIINLYDRLIGRIERMPGLFRFLTILAFEKMIDLKRENKLDVAIIEVGMGGRYDSTNVIEAPIVTAITSLSMEHVRSLGPSLEDIAYHKVGIAKPDIPMITIPQQVESINVIKSYCSEIGAPLSFVDAYDMDVVNSACLGIKGHHQYLNAALAFRIAKEWWRRISPSDKTLNKQTIIQALENTFWPGRSHKIELQDFIWYLDGAHTVESIKYSLEWFDKEDRHDTPSTLLFHCTHDRNHEILLDPILKYHQIRPFNRIFFVKPQSPIDSNESKNDLSLHESMALYWNKVTDSQSASAISIEGLFENLCRDTRRIFVTGSLYLVGDILRVLNHHIR